MAKSYHNIERALTGKFYQYVGWDRSGNFFTIEKHHSYRGYRVAQPVALNNTIPYFYARTLRDVSETLETIN